MDRYLDDVPESDEVRRAVVDVFERMRTQLGSAILSALVPVDTTMEQGTRVLNWTPSFELGELCSLAEHLRDLVQAESRTGARGRLQLLFYCHVFEADFPLTTIWNLHRLLLLQDCSWTFHRITARGTQEILKYPSQRVDEIRTLSEQAGTRLGGVLARLWSSELRNAFSHSQYFWEDDVLTCTGRLSPVSRTGQGVGPRGSSSFTSHDIDDLYDRAAWFLHEFLAAYENTSDMFKDGDVHGRQWGPVRWHAERMRWMWVDADDT